jgi:dihydrofolate synthase/folylpolyglutamate synthase
MSPKDALDTLLSLPRYAGVDDDSYKPGLARMTALLDAMDRPHKSFRSVHVAGTNGKGSVASMVAAIGTAAGARVGLHTSPHLSHVTERMRVDGTPAPDDWLADAVSTHRDAFADIAPSFFEATVALSFRYFADQNVDGAIVEVGLGGRLDATNVLHPALSIITSIDLDHTNLLGDTLAEIAREKAGIVKPNTPVVSGVTQPEAQQTIREIAEERGAPLHAIDDETSWTVRQSDLSGTTLDLTTPLRRYADLHVSLPGAHQERNAVLATRAAEIALQAVQGASEPVRDGLADVQRWSGLRGRLDVLATRPWIVADVAHNPASLRATLDTVAPDVADRGGQLYVAFSLSRDKDLDGILQLFDAHNAIMQPVPVDVHRSTPPDDLAAAAREAGLRVRDPRSPEDTLSAFRRTAAPEDLLLVTGSHDLVATVLSRTADRGPQTADDD